MPAQMRKEIPQKNRTLQAAACRLAAWPTERCSLGWQRLLSDWVRIGHFEIRKVPTWFDLALS